MGNRFQRSWQVARESYGVLRSHPALTIFPVLSGIVTVLVSIPFIAVIILAAIATNSAHAPREAFDAVHYALMAVTYFVNYFVVIFFNSALVACANEVLQGRSTSVSFGFKAAVARLPQILGWALIASTVGVILRMISERAGLIGSIVASLIGLAWNLAVYFVIPGMVIDRESPVDAIKGSAGMIKQTWGERVILGIGMGSAMMVFVLLAMIPVAAAIYLLVAGLYAFAAILIVLAVLSILALATIGSAMGTIFTTALYLYCRTGLVPAGYAPASLQGAFAEKTKGGLFGR